MGFDSLSSGSYGLRITDGQWELYSGDDQSGLYTRQMTVSDEQDNGKDIVCAVQWEGPFDDQQVVLRTRLSQWQ